MAKYYLEKIPNEYIGDFYQEVNDIKKSDWYKKDALELYRSEINDKNSYISKENYKHTNEYLNKAR